jgi:glycosyltransferase involved in cell wall biosynthesis
MRKRRIAVISFNASPLKSNLKQSIYVAETARNLRTHDWEVDVFTRCDSADLPEIFDWTEGVRVIHVPAGFAGTVENADLLRLVPQFISSMIRFFKQQRYDIVHANFFLSGLVALNLKRTTETPFVVTFHELGRRSQKEVSEFSDVRFDIEDRVVREAAAIVAESVEEKTDLMYLYDAMPEKISVISSETLNLQEKTRQLAALYETVLAKTKVSLTETARLAMQNLKQSSTGRF